MASLLLYPWLMCIPLLLEMLEASFLLLPYHFLLILPPLFLLQGLYVLVYLLADYYPSFHVLFPV